MMTVQEQVGPQVLILMVVGAPLQVLVKVQAPELVREEGVVGCASVYYSCSFSRRNIAACEQAPCLLDVPLHCGNWHFGGAQERKGSVDKLCI
jgi:hypothetical protein